MDDIDLARWVRPGDGIVIGQACGEPLPLVTALAGQAASIGSVRVFAGLSYAPAIATLDCEVVSYGALGHTARAPNLQVVPGHYSGLPRLFAQRRLPCDVLMVQVAPPDAHGRCSLGLTVDYLADVLPFVRTVIAEVNASCPRTTGAWIDADRIDLAVETDRTPLEAPAAAPDDVDRRIAGHVAELIADGDTIQLGVGSLPEAILGALRDHRDLGIHSGMISDAVLGLLEAGAVTNARKGRDDGVTVTGAALGSQRLFAALDGREDIRFAPVSVTHDPLVLAGVGRLAAINSAVQVDLSGQVNGEAIGPRRIGAIGGQADFLRAAWVTGGRPIVALPARRIVRTLDGPASTSRADVDWVVTEHGARSLSGLTDAARARALTELAGGDVA